MWFHFLMFYCWHILILLTPSSSSSPHLDKLIRKPACSFLWFWQEIQTMQVPSLCVGIPTQPQPLTKIKVRSQSTFLAFSSHFTPAWEACPDRLRNLNCEINICISSWYVCSIISLSIQTKFWELVHLPEGWTQLMECWGGSGCNLALTHKRKTQNVGAGKSETESTLQTRSMVVLPEGLNKILEQGDAWEDGRLALQFSVGPPPRGVPGSPLTFSPTSSYPRRYHPSLSISITSICLS